MRARSKALCSGSIWNRVLPSPLPSKLSVGNLVDRSSITDTSSSNNSIGAALPGGRTVYPSVSRSAMCDSSPSSWISFLRRTSASLPVGNGSSFHFSFASSLNWLSSLAKAIRSIAIMSSLKHSAINVYELSKKRLNTRSNNLNLRCWFSSTDPGC